MYLAVIVKTLDLGWPLKCFKSSQGKASLCPVCVSKLICPISPFVLSVSTPSIATSEKNNNLLNNLLVMYYCVYRLRILREPGICYLLLFTSPIAL